MSPVYTCRLRGDSVAPFVVFLFLWKIDTSEMNEQLRPAKVSPAESAIKTGKDSNVCSRGSAFMDFNFGATFDKLRADFLLLSMFNRH